MINKENITSNTINFNPLKKIRLTFICFLLFLFQIWNINTLAQLSGKHTIDEEVVLFTDRNIYVAGEQIHYSAYIYYDKNVEQPEISKIVYTELIDSEKEKIAGHKHLIEESRGSGYFNIPKEIISGNYFIRAYTKYMRNIGPEIYSYIPLKIINPYKNDVLLDENKKISDNIENNRLNNKDSLERIKVSVHKNKFKTREQVKLSIANYDEIKDSVKGICLTVVPASSFSNWDFQYTNAFDFSQLDFSPQTSEIVLMGRLIDENSGEYQANKTINLVLFGDDKTTVTGVTDALGRFKFELPDIVHKGDSKDSTRGLFLTIASEDSFDKQKLVSSKKINFSNLNYYPETRGVSLTGQLIEKETGELLANKALHLSIMGEENIFIPKITDLDGKFYYTLPDINGKNDIYIYLEDSINAEILVDNDFCTKPYNLLSKDFKLTLEERQVIYNFAVNTQMSSYFESKKDTISKPIETNEYLFYGKPSEVISFDEYILLPTLEDYFTELPSSAKLRKKRGKKYFKITSDHSTMSIYNPLILLDGLALNDVERVLTASPQRISRIEVINEPYIKGDLYYAGIISIISKKGDFAGIDLPDYGIFINYNFLGEENINIPRKKLSKNHPDLRNTLLWDPSITLDDKISFLTSDTPGEYIILLRGITNNGDIITGSERFSIEN